MATFNPYTRATKETINVDFNDRHSPQKVILCNRENQFYGKFIGKVDTKDVFISGGTLVGVTLSDVVIYDKNGIVDISKIADTLANICAVIDIDIPEISSLARKNESSIVELSDYVVSLSASGDSQSSAIFYLRRDVDKVSSDIEQLSTYCQDAILTGDFGAGGRIDFFYDRESKKIKLGTSDENFLSIDCEDFVRDGMISSVECVDIGDGKKVLRISWNLDSGKTESTDIPLSSLVGGVYRGDGKYIEINDLTIGFDSEKFKNEGLSGYDDIYLYCKSLSGEDGTIFQLSDQLSILLNDGRSLKYSAHINDASDISGGFANYVEHVLCRDFVPNGMLVPVVIDGFDGIISCRDGMILGSGDVIIVHDHGNNKIRVPVDELVFGENVKVYKAGVSRYELAKNKQDISQISNWIDSNFYGFDQDSENIVTKKGLSVENLSANNIHAENLDYEKVWLKVDGNEVVSVITSISETNGIISVEASKLEKSMVNGLTGTLDQLCAGLSTKIYIENPDENLSDYSDLSVVKISKEDYDNLVSKEKTNEKTIYIVESNVIDAYGEKIINVQDATDISDAVNLNVLTSKIDENTDRLSVENINLYNEGQAVSVLTSISEARGVVSVGTEILETRMISGLVDTLSTISGDIAFVPGDGEWSAVQKIGNTETEITPSLESYQNYASSFAAVAEGIGTSAIGIGSHSEGVGSLAIGYASHVEGADNINGRETPDSDEELLYPIAEGYASHAEGAGYAKGDYSHAEGAGNAVLSANSKLSARWYDQPTCPTAQGKYSHAEGTHTWARGPNSHAEGDTTLASGRHCHAEGGENKSFGDYSHSEGYQNDISGTASHVEGYSNNGGGEAAHIEGKRNSIVGIGEANHVEGADNKVNVTNDINTLAVNHVEGISNNLLATGGDGANHIEGKGNKITANAGKGSNHAEGLENKISSYNGANPYAAHVEGYSNVAYGIISHAEGYGTIVKGECSHTEGSNTRTTNNFEHAQGRFNKSHSTPHSGNNYPFSTNTIHSVGIGNGEGTRKNAVEVMQNGDVYVVNVGGYDGSNLSGNTLQQTISDLSVKFDTLDYEKVQLKVDGNDVVSVLTSISESDGIISVEATQLEKSMVNGLTGTLNDLCAGLSTKIYIENPDENLSDYSDLSVVKISKEDYDKLVSDGETNGRTIYIVDSNVIDAYGQKIVNVQDATNISDAVNLNVLTSKLDEKIESLSIDSNIETKIGNAIDKLSIDTISLYGEGQAISVLTSISETSGVVSVGYSQLEKSMVNGLTGTLNDLCAGLSTKIYIENPDENLSDYSDLSVVKISKEDYELLVAGGNISPRSIYIISSDVIDAYEQKIVNVQDATDQMDAVNLRTLNRTMSSAKPLSDYYNDNSLEGIDWNQLQLNKMAEMLSVIFNTFGKVQ